MSLRRLWIAVRGRLGGSGEPSNAPDEGLRRLVRDLDEAFHRIEQSVGRALVDERRLRADLEEVEVRVGEWHDRACRALERADEDLARQALVRKKEHESAAARIRASWEVQRRATDDLKASLRSVRERSDEARRRYAVLLSRWEAAAATRQVQESLHAASGSPAASAGRLDGEIRRLEAEIEAHLEVTGGVNPASTRSPR